MSTTYFLSIQGSYSQLEISLFQDSQCLKTIHHPYPKYDKQSNSSMFIPLIKEILENHSLTLNDLKFIAADQGPGAFTSLRVTISTLNGLSYANKIPLIGIDGLKALAKETIDNFIKNPNNPKIDLFIPILNAYNNEVYYSITDEYGYKKVNKLIEDIKEKFNNKKILFVGNGLELHKKLLQDNFKDNIYFDSQLVCSSQQIAKMALEKWNKEEGLTFKLTPLYLKS